MRDFLAEIGADNLSPVLSTNHTPRHVELFDRVTSELESLALTTSALLTRDWDSFSSTVHQGRSLSSKLDRISREVDSLEREQAALLPPLLDQVSVHSSLSKSHATASAATALLSALANLHSLVLPLASHQSFSPALVPQLLSLRSQLSHPPDPWIASIPLYVALTKWARSEDKRVCAALNDALEGAVIITKDPRGLVVAQPLEPLLDSLAQITSQIAVNTYLNRISNSISNQLVVPLLTAPSETTFPDANTLVVSPASLADDRAPLQSLSALLNFLPPPIRPLIPVTTLLIDHHLTPLLPTSLPDSSFVVALQEAEAFDPGVREWVQNVGRHWAKKVRESIFTEARDIVLRWEWTETTTTPWPDYPTPTSKPVPLPSDPTSENAVTEVVPSERQDQRSSSPSTKQPPFVPPQTPPSKRSSAAFNGTSSRPSSSLFSPALVLDIDPYETENDEEEDAWGLGSAELELPDAAAEADFEHFSHVGRESAPSPPELQPPSPPKDEASFSPSSPNDDGWGFDEEAAMGDDDWGFGVEEEAEDIPGTVKVPSVMSEAESKPLEEISVPPQQPSTPSHHPTSSSLENVPPVRSTRLISSATKSFLALASSADELSKAVESPTYPHKNMFSTSSNLLATTPSALLALFRAALPAAHGQLLRDVPAIALQFANDLDFIQGKEAEALAKRWRDDLLEAQKTELMECLDAADGFRNTGDAAVYASAERAVDQVIHSLEQVAGIWKPVMDAPSFYTSLGLLVETVLQRVLDEIEAQSDISEDESISLNQLCRKLHVLEDLFEEDFSVGGEVPIWFKFVFLSELLEASMVDIIFLFDNGHLVDFEVQEIERLVRALFADSPARRENLAHIAKGMPKASSVDGDGDGPLAGDEDERWE